MGTAGALLQELFQCCGSVDDSDAAWSLNGTAYCNASEATQGYEVRCCPYRSQTARGAPAPATSAPGLGSPVPRLWRGLGFGRTRHGPRYGMLISPSARRSTALLGIVTVWAACAAKDGCFKRAVEDTALYDTTHSRLTVAGFALYVIGVLQVEPI